MDRLLLFGKGGHSPHHVLPLIIETANGLCLLSKSEIAKYTESMPLQNGWYGLSPKGSNGASLSVHKTTQATLVASFG